MICKGFFIDKLGDLHAHWSSRKINVSSFLHNNHILCLTANGQKQKSVSTIAALICRTVESIVLKQQISELPYKLHSSAMCLLYVYLFQVKAEATVFLKMLQYLLYSQTTNRKSRLAFIYLVKLKMSYIKVQFKATFILLYLPEYFIILNQGTEGQR